MYKSDAAWRHNQETHPQLMDTRWQVEPQTTSHLPRRTIREFPSAIARNVIGLGGFFGILWLCAMIVVEFIYRMAALVDMASLPLAHHALLDVAWKPSFMLFDAVWKPSLMSAVVIFLLILAAGQRENPTERS